MQSTDISSLEHGLKQCLLDKNKHIKKDIAIKFETLCSSVNKDISEDNKEDVHDFLWSAANPFTKIIYRTKKTLIVYWNLYKEIKT